MRRALAVLLSLSLFVPQLAFAVGQERGQVPGAAPAVHAGPAAANVHVPGPSAGTRAAGQRVAPVAPIAAGLQAAAPGVEAAATRSAVVAPLIPSDEARVSEAALAQAQEAAREAAPQTGAAAWNADGEPSFFDGAWAKVKRAPGAVLAATSARLDTLSGGRLSRHKAGREARKARLLSPEAKPFTKDDFGGPQALDLTKKEQLRYGLRWGLHLTALVNAASGLAGMISAVLPADATFAKVAPVVGGLPFVSWFLGWPELLKAGATRMELLVDYGPKQIEALLATHPIAFLAGYLPFSVLQEELTYRAPVWLAAVALPLLAYALRAAIAKAAGLPDGLKLGLRGPGRAAKWVLKKLAKTVFPIVAVTTALAFGRAHFAHWGLNTEALLLPSVAGLALAWVAWRTRSLIPGLVAHFTYNLLFLGTTILAAVAAPVLLPYTLALTFGSIAFLLYEYYTYRKAKAAALGDGLKRTLVMAGVKTKLLVSGLTAAFLMMSGPVSPPTGALNPMMEAPEAPIQLAQPLKERKILTPTQIIEMNRPAIVKVVLKNAQGRPVGNGTGSILTARGLMVTNNHVAGGVGIGGKVYVELSDGSEVEGVVVAANKRDDVDLAFVQLPWQPGKDYQPVVIGDSDQLKHGDPDVAAGWPLQLPFTVTSGIISGLGEAEKRGGYEIQTDAVVNPGNSGGPLFNQYGEQIGINTAILSNGSEGRAAKWGGVSFARSTAAMLKYLQQYEKTGSISPAWLGVVFDRTNPLLFEGGLLLEDVKLGSPAYLAGLRPGDRLTRLDGKELPRNAMGAMLLRNLLLSKKAHDELSLTFERDGASQTVKVKLGEWLVKPSGMFKQAPGAPKDGDDDEE